MDQDTNDHDGHFENYAEYSRTFRSWMVAYGIGGPVLFLTNKDAPDALAKSPHLQTIVALFVLGVGLQILLALINKWAAWHMYRGAFAKHQRSIRDPEGDHHDKSKTYKVWRWINRQSWIDFVVDIGAFASFSIATWLVLKAILTAQPIT